MPDRNFPSCILLSIGFWVSFSAFNGCSALISKIYDDMDLKGLGQINTFCIYLTLAFGNIFVSKIVACFKHPKHIIQVGALIFSTYYLAGMMTSLCTVDGYAGKGTLLCETGFLKAMNIFVSCLIGLAGATLVWSGQYAYIVFLSNSSNRGKYFGTFYSFLGFTQTLGNGFNAVYYQFNNAGSFLYFCLLFFLAMVAMVIFCFLPTKNKNLGHNDTDNDDWVDQTNNQDQNRL